MEDTRSSSRKPPSHWEKPLSCVTRFEIHATDRYALGLVLFDLLLGRPAAVDATRRAAALRRAVTDLEEGKTLEDFRHHADDARLLPLLRLCAALTETDPAQRPTDLTFDFDHRSQ